MSNRDIASLALGAVGAFFAPAGFGALGFALGSAVGAALVPEPGISGPRLQDLNVQTSSYGAPIPIVYGSTRLAGNVIWARPLRERKKKQGGGKGGGPSYTTYSYFGTWAVGLCEGEIAGIRRIWFDTVLVYDVGENATAESLIASGEIAERITVYPGSETQQPDPLMEASEGMGNVPAYRGLAYLVVHDLPLERYGNRIPNVTVEVVTTAGDLTTGTIANITMQGDRIGTYMDAGVDGMVLTIESGLVSAGDHYDMFSRAPDLAEATRRPAENLGDSPGKAALEVHGGNAEFQLSGDGTFGLCKLIRHGQYVCALAPTSTAGETWWFGEAQNNPGYGELIWFRAGRLYLGVRRTGSGGIRWNAIFSWASLPPSVSEIAATERSPEGRAVASYAAFGIDVDTGTGWTPDFVMYVSRDGSRVYAINAQLELKVFDAELNQLDLIDVSWLPLIPAAFAIEDGLLHTALNTGPIQYFRIYRLDTQAQTYELDWGSSFGYPCRIVPVGGVVYVQDRDVARAVRVGGLESDVVPLSSIVSDLCTRAGVTDIDVSALTQSVRGYTVTQPMTARAAIEPLQQAWFFDAAERDGQIVFVNRGGAAVAEIEEDELATHGDGEQRPDPFATARVQDAELPRRILVEHMEPARDYQTGTQHASRLATEALSEQTVRLPIVLNAGEAAGIAQVLLHDAWMSRTSVPVSLLAAQHIALNAADAITVHFGGRSYRLRLTRVSYAVPGIVQCEAVLDDASIYQAIAVGDIPALGTAVGVGLPGPTVSELMDIPLLRDVDDPDGIYVGGAGVLSGWQGASILTSFDSGVTYQTLAVIPESATMGIAETALAHGPSTIIDRGNSVQVTLVSGELESATQAQLLNGANAALLGDEVIQFQTATHISGKTYELSTLARGRRGTEWARSAHAVGERFVLLGTDLARPAIPRDRIGTDLFWRTVSVGNDALDVEPVVLGHEGRAHKPYAPAHLALAVVPGGTEATWVRRTRIGGEWRDYVDVPLGEAAELYRVDVLENDVLISTVDVDTAAAVVSANIGAVVRVAQISEAVGPGYASTAVVGPGDVQGTSTDFSEYSTGVAPADWTARWVTSGVTYSVVEDSGAIGGKVARVNVSTAGRHALSWDAAGSSVADVVVRAKLRANTSTSDQAQNVLVARGSGASGSESGYICYLNRNPDRLRIGKFVSGTFTLLVEEAFSWSDGQWYWLEFNLSGDRLDAKVWALADPEPGDWMAGANDASLASGWLGIYGQHASRITDYDVYSFEEAA